MTLKKKKRERGEFKPGTETEQHWIKTLYNLML